MGAPSRPINSKLREASSCASFSKPNFFFPVVCERASAHPLLIPRRLISVSINSVSCVLRQQLIAPLPSPSCKENPSFFLPLLFLYWSDPSTLTAALSRANINKVGKSCGGLTALPGDSANLNPNSRGAAEAQSPDGNSHHNTAALFNSVDFCFPKQI